MVCPKCGVPIKRFDLAPNCKNCGVHIMYYTQEEDLARDAKKTELEFASARAVTARLKAAFIAGKKPIARMVTVILCVAALCIPFASFTVSLPLWQQKISAGAIGVYSMISDSSFMHLLDFMNAGLAQSVAAGCFAVLVLFAVTVLLTLAVFAAWLLSFINLRKAAKTMCVLSAAAVVVTIAAFITALAVKGSAQELSFLQIDVGFGSLAAAVAFAAFFVINFIMYKENAVLSLKETDLKRIEIYKKFKAGELTLDELPLPVVYDEAEQEARTSLLGGGSKKEKKDKNKKKESVKA